MPVAAYLFAYLVPLLGFLSLAWGGPWVLLAPAFVFVLVPILERHLPGTTQNRAARGPLERRLGDLLLYGLALVQVGMVVALLWVVKTGHIEGWALLGAVGTVGLSCGALGINVAHELGHRSRRFEQNLARVLLGSTLYAHFIVEHNRGHHARVATPEDPASARRGETVYGFWLRSVPGGFASAWDIEASRLRRQGRSALSLRNEVLVGLIVQVALVALAAAWAGPLAALCWMAASVTGWLLLETVNYIEHYGLSRARGEDGRYERVRPAHSWNSNRTLGRLLLFDLTRHADHHAHPSRPYLDLRHFDEAPELPAGYPTSILLALVPPLWFAVMHPALGRLQEAEAASL
jgi:alkane 1-monooxygenase